MDPEQVRLLIRNELYQYNIIKKQARRYEKHVLIENMVVREVEKQTDRLITGSLRFAIYDYLITKPKFKKIMDDSIETIQEKLEKEQVVQYGKFKVQCDTYVDNNLFFKRFVSKSEYHDMNTTQTLINIGLGVGFFSLLGFNFYKHFSDDK